MRDGEEVEGVRNGPGRDQPSHVPSAAEDHPDHEVGSDMSFISFPFPSEPRAKDVRSERLRRDGMEREVMKDMERTEVSNERRKRSQERGLSDVSRFPVPRLFPSLSTPYSRLVSRRRGEGSTNEERDDRDETRNTGDDQGSVCKVGTQDPENLDEELKPLVTVWSLRCRFVCSASRYTPLLTSSPPPEGRQEVGGEGKGYL